ncbi:hypothetical protein [Mesorhizobium sp. B2-4-9]|uniref:hypothetical protein n=1 Tax=Mesorhizobium sp. B2-4-9 TaxID=2589940 RepID=UPI00112E94EB|nr:hypothetical protein [Mesorhizobium sp. B2-4-9]
MGDILPAKVGSLIFETYDFGNARKINAVYQCLLKITPFSKVESAYHDELLRDRNLIVHHGSVFTTRYLDQIRDKDNAERNVSDAFWNSLVVDRERVSKAIGFLSELSKKIVKASQKALESHLAEKLDTMDPERRTALDLLGWWDGHGD